VEVLKNATSTENCKNRPEKFSLSDKIYDHIRAADLHAFLIAHYFSLVLRRTKVELISSKSIMTSQMLEFQNVFVDFMAALVLLILL
jgi:hypothetical protein